MNLRARFTSLGESKQSQLQISPELRLNPFQPKQKVNKMVEQESTANLQPGFKMDATKAQEIQARYSAERAKRLRPDGAAQYIDLSLSQKFTSYQSDPWLSPSKPYSNTHTLSNTKSKILILGAGFGGLLYAARLIEAGIPSTDIRLVDTAGGFGGTWYWNRYPGLMCDVESYIYMPLLEEMGYMPKHKYAYGPELREYAEMVADRYRLREQALLQTKVEGMTWDDEGKEWVVELCELRNGEGEEDKEFQVKTQFVISASGVLNFPQLPNLKGVGEFQGENFHTSRWNYQNTGGSPTDPALVNLRDNNVAIIGTGATAVQAIPHLAKWAKHLYIFQRTPSAVDERGQRETDPEWWNEMTKEKGWQRKRNQNFNAHMGNVANGAENMVDDEWSRAHSYGALIGSPLANLSLEGIPAYIGKLHAMDLPRTERVRARVDQIVKDKETAEKLKAWYPTWCKRPCFHDDYLPVFNRPNVTLVDTDGHGVDGLSRDGVLYNDKEYKVDVLIFSTGYRSPVIGTISGRANMHMKGRGGKTMDENWADGVITLHGVITPNFPNLFFPGPMQAAAGPNQSLTLDQLAQHTAYIITQAMKNVGSKNIVLEPTQEAVQAWGIQVLMRAGALAGNSGCTPSYLNLEGQLDKLTSHEERMKAARGTIWGQGIESYLETVTQWRAKGDLEGIEVTVV